MAFYLKEDSFVIIDGEKIFVEIAETRIERQKGLMYREELCDDCGMLFIFDEEEVHSFWMKNTYIALDMIFIDSDRKIVDILHTVPCEEEVCESYIPNEKARSVLEVNAGMFDESVIGKIVEMKL